MGSGNHSQQTFGYRHIISHPITCMEKIMAKGQLRSNKEAKKPKKEKKPAPPAGGFLVPQKSDKTTNSKS
jgi:hypothetical protein